MSKQIAVYDNTVSARTYIGYIAEQAGGFACIGRNGKLYIRTIGESIAELPLSYFQNYSWGEKIKITRVRYEDGVQLFEIGDETGNTLYISQDNMYIVDQEQINNIYNQVKELEVYSFEGDSIIDPALDIGDLLLIDGKYVIYQGSSEYKGKFKASISSKIQCKAKEETTTRTTSQKTINRRVQSQIDQIDGTITQLVEEIGDRSERSTTVTQDIDQLRVAVAEVINMSRETTGSDTVHITDTVEGNGYVLDLVIYGSTENMHYVTPEEDLVPSNSLVPNGGYITIVCDTVGRTNISENAYKYRIKLDEPLRDLGDIKDELNISNSGVVTVTRRLGTTGGINGTVYVLDEEVTETLENITITTTNGTEKSTKAILHTFEDETYIYVKEFRYLNFEIKYITQSDYSEQFITKVDFQSSLTVAVDEILAEVSGTYVSETDLQTTTIELESKISQTQTNILSTVSQSYATKTELENTETTLQSSISQTSTSILSTVSATYATQTSLNSVNNTLTASLELKVNTEDLISEINASADQIKLTAGRLIITSGNFKLDASGNITATNANISGTITSNAGTIRWLDGKQ